MTTSLKALCLGLLSLSFLPTSPLTAAESSTPVIGYYKVTVPAGTSSWGTALVNKTLFQGQGVVAGAVITQAGAAWAADQFTGNGTSNYYVEILSGAQTGAVFDILSSTPTTLTLDVNIGSAPFNITGATSYCIRKHTTLADVFLTSGLEPYDQIVTIYNDLGQTRTYGTDGVNIVDAGDFSTIKDNEILYPGQGFLITGTASKQLTFGGGGTSYIKSGPTKVWAYAGIVNLITVMNPLAGDTPADVSSASANGFDLNLEPYGDIVFDFNKTGDLSIVKSFGSDGTNVVDAGDFETVLNSYSLKNSTAFMLSPVVTGFFTQSPTIP